MAAPWRGHPYAGYYAGQQSTNGYNTGMPQPQIPQQAAAGFYQAELPFPSPQPASYDLPHSLRPGGGDRSGVPPRRETVHYFLETPNPHVSPQIRHTQSAPAPPLPRKPDFSQPPLPPKPDYSFPDAAPPRPHIPHWYASAPEFPSYPPSIPTSPRKSESEDEIMKRVLAMSARESAVQRQRILEEEEEELTRAMQESLSMEPARPPHMPMHPLVADNVDLNHAAPVVTSPVEFTQFPSANTDYFPHYDTPQFVPRLLTPDAHHLPNRRYQSQASSSGLRPASQITDEALARRLVDEEDDTRRPPRHPSGEAGRSSQRPSMGANRPSMPNMWLPKHEERFPPPPMPQSVPAPSLAPHNTTADDIAVAPPMLRSTSARASIPTQDHAVARRPAYADVNEESNDERGSTSRPEQTGPSPRSSVPTPDFSSTPESMMSTATSASEGGQSLATSRTTTPATQYADDELFWGVSMGFGVPTVTPTMKPMQGPVPNVVSLPYGRSAPFHIRAPTWRHLLKLMARLGSTRIEPSVEAIMEVKTVMQLRVVVSFVRTHETLSDWNTVLYVSINQGAPGSSPYVLKYRSGDTGTLPYSYTLSSPLAVLRDGPDAPMSKFYTIPTTAKTPYPTLPITFPNLAAYLTSALDDSRSAHDNTTGMRRLAKYVDNFYPSKTVTTDATAAKNGMGQKLMSFVGIRGRQPSRDMNAETFDLVTPFVADDYGH